MQGVLQSQLQTANEETEIKKRYGSPYIFLFFVSLTSDVICPYISDFQFHSNSGSIKNSKLCEQDPYIVAFWQCVFT